MNKEKQSFYFTFGTDKKQPFMGGWVIIKANDIIEAKEKFIAKFGLYDGYLPCAFYYTESQFKNTNMYKENDNLGNGCHLIIK